MKSNKPLIATIAIVAVGIGWYAFRPELIFVNQSVHESLPGATAQSASMKEKAPTSLEMGNFRSIAHETKGTATVYQLSEGKRVLRLTNFKTSNGPDVHVFLVAAKDAPDNDTVKSSGYVDLGSIKGNEGDQNYDIPADLDLKKYQSATIWCNRFKVNFGTASLTGQGS